jgi:hypothetical protein
MKSLRALCLGVVAVMGILTAQLAYPQIFPLLDNSVVISLDYRGDRLVRIDQAPTLSIFADGRISMPQSYAHTQAFEGQMSSEELQSLLTFIITEHRFFEYNAVQAQAQQTQVRRQPLPTHYATTVIKVSTADRQKEVSIAALERPPVAAENQGMLAIKNRLDELMAVTKLGGADQVGLMLSELQLSTADVAPSGQQKRTTGATLSEQQASTEGKSIQEMGFTAADLRSGTRRPDGSMSAQFVRSDESGVHRLNIEVTADGQQHITVSGQ